MPIAASPIERTRRHLRRYRQIADVLVRHGFANVADQLGLKTPKRFLWGHRREEEALSVPERVVIALQELGPTFVKFGQVLSTRPDILPDDVIAELERLQDELPPFAFADAREIITEELQAPIETLFATFEREPLAAASIGQVHRATLTDGTQVVVKVRRPGIVRQIKTDTEVLTDLAALAERRTGWGKRYAVGDIVAEFARSLEEQVDFTLEASYATRFRERLSSGIDIPEVVWELTTQRVLTMRYAETIKVSRIEQLQAAGHDLSQIAQGLLDYSLRSALLDGMFHGDPHPGNIGVRTDGTLVFVDFGLVGFLDPQLRRHIGDLIVGFVGGDEHGCAVALMDIGRVRDRSGLDELATEVGRLFRRYYEQSLARASVGEVLISAVRMVGKYGARVPGEAALFMKTLVSVEGLCLQLDPRLNVREIARPVAGRLMDERFSPERLTAIFRKNAHTTARLAADFPARFERLMEKVEAGSVKMTVDVSELDHFQDRLDVITNRVVVGVLVAATLVSSALMFRSGLGPSWQGIPLLGAGGFLTGFVIGARLFLAIMKSGNI